MKIPTTYYGGKQRMAKRIVSLFPKGYENQHYIEPFAGGLSVFFKKKPSKAETISDLDPSVYALYKELRDNYKKLRHWCAYTPYGRNEFNAAKKIHRNPTGYSDFEKAWALFTVSNSSFGCLGISFGIAVTVPGPSRTNMKNNKVLWFNEARRRLINCRILNEDALEVIKKTDSPESLFYLDPPYPGSDQSPYKSSFSAKKFNQMIEILKGIKGKFLLSFYERDELAIPPEWKIHKFAMRLLGGEAVFQGTTKRVEIIAKNF